MRKTLIFMNSINDFKLLVNYLNRVIKIKIIINFLSNILIFFLIYIFLFSLEAEASSFMYLSIPLSSKNVNTFSFNGPPPLGDSIKETIQIMTTETHDSGTEATDEAFVDTFMEDSDLTLAIAKENIKKSHDIARMFIKHGRVDTKLNAAIEDSIVELASDLTNETQAMDAANSIKHPDVPGIIVFGSEVNLAISQESPQERSPLVGNNAKLEQYKTFSSVSLGDKKIANLFEIENKDAVSIEKNSAIYGGYPVIHPEKPYFLPLDKKLFPQHTILSEIIHKNRIKGYINNIPQPFSENDIKQIVNTKRYFENQFNPKYSIF